MSRFLRLALIGYLVVILMFSLLQTSIIFPGAASQGQKQAVVIPAPNEELVKLKTADGTDIVAIFGAAQSADGRVLSDAPSRPTLLFFYGNGMCLADCDGLSRAMRQQGLNVLIPDFVGYGMSGGKPSEAGVYATAEAAYAHLLTRSDIDKTKIIPSGWSLGSAAAIELASKHPVPALVLMSAFTSMKDMARKVLPIFPSSLMLQHHFDNETKLRGIDCPILILHGRHDSIIPFVMSERLERAAKGAVKRIPIESDHNDLFDEGGEQMFDLIGEFSRGITGTGIAPQ